MKILNMKQIQDYVSKNDYVLLIFKAIGKNYVSICLKHQTSNRKNKPDKPLSGRIYDEESFRVLYKIYQITKFIKFRYLKRTDFHHECYYLFIKGLDSHLQLGGNLDKDFFDEAVLKLQNQFEILKQVFQ